MRRTLIASSISLALAAFSVTSVQAASSDAGNCQASIEQQMGAATDEAAVSLAVRQQITECTQPAPDVVTRAIQSRPDQAVVIVRAAVEAAPDQLHAIVEAAIAAAPDQAELIVSAVTDAMPTAAGSTGDSPTPRKPDSLPSGGSGGGAGGGTTASSS
ncbi:hypothetical protein SAMN05216421_2546 [Halopseudomonas xinjiangensis]|uniref:HEAT repeat-containing protein n=1 Tax=Halopseudomonas xinjiangensis TaxID=487184 RepID=A0A1H1WBW6_9GAMM|nr:hypothetical protein [Halopseudomonas xinjiangensis]SDS94808.1 hypothetical protein SAMN05216421_2546 [Halopseudomonas xinjiangensis]